MRPVTPLLARNFSEDDFGAEPNEIFESRYRNAMFAGVCKRDGAYIAFTDHLGNIPLYYRRSEDGDFVFSSHLDDIVRKGDRISIEGAHNFLAFSNAKTTPFIEGVRSVPPGTVIRLDPKTGSETVIYRYRLRVGGGRFNRNPR